MPRLITRFYLHATLGGMVYCLSAMVDAGHILGSSMIELAWNGKKLLLTGWPWAAHSTITP